MFLDENSNNTLNFDGNGLNCDSVVPYLWLLNNKNRYQLQVLFANCHDGASIWDLDPNNFPSNSSTPPSGSSSTTPSGGSSTTPLISSTVDPGGSAFDWLDDLLDKNITSVEEVEKTLEVIIENTGNSSSLNTMESLQKVVEIVSKLENFLKNKTIESSMRMARKWMNVG